MKNNEAGLPAKQNPATVQMNSWDQVSYWSNIATKGAMVMTAAMVMTGFSLAALRKTYSGQGKRTDLSADAKAAGLTSPHDAAKLGWQEAVKKYAGVSDDTALRWITTAEGVKARWRKNPPQKRICELMSTPVTDWTDADSKLVFDALAKAIDGSTMIDFMRDLGIVKKISAGPGRLPECDNTKKNLTPSEQFELRREQARLDWEAVNKLHMTYRDKFVVLADDEITAQIAVLEQDLNARKAWLKNPATKRDPKAIAEMFNVKGE